MKNAIYYFLILICASFSGQLSAQDKLKEDTNLPIIHVTFGSGFLRSEHVVIKLQEEGRDSVYVDTYLARPLWTTDHNSFDLPLRTHAFTITVSLPERGLSSAYVYVLKKDFYLTFSLTPKNELILWQSDDWLGLD
jgi:hypothetical protein